MSYIGRNALLALFTLIICTAGRAQFTTIAYDGFNYSAGSLDGQNGGSGWIGAWTNTYKSGATLQVSTNGMFYPGLTNSGGCAIWGSGGNGLSEDSRFLPRQSYGVVYFRFLSKFAPTSGGGTPNFRLLDSGVLTGGFGGNGGTHGNFMSILDSTLSPAADGSSSSSASLASTNLVVARIDYTARKTSMWVNPDLSTFDYANPGTTPNAVYTNLAPAFDGFSLISRNPAFVDEIAILYQAGPTPSPVLDSPVSSSTSNNVFISYTLPVAPLTGTVQLSFINDQHTLTLTMTNSTNVSFVLHPSNPLASSNIVSAVPSTGSLPDGIYNVVLSYRDSNGDPTSTIAATNITVDTTTLFPVLLAPTNNATAASSGLPINYYLPDAPNAGSVFLTFQSSATNLVLHLNDSLTNDFVVSPEFMTNAAITSPTTPFVLPDGNYQVALTYSDWLLNPSASTVATNIVVDTVTLPAVLLGPSDNAIVNSTGLHISYQLPEAPAAGSVTVTFQNSTTSIVLHLDDSLTNGFIVSPPSLINAAITSATSTVLPDGIYSVQFSYQDALLNPSVFTTVTNVVVDTVTLPPALLAPTNNVVANATGLHVRYELPEVPASGSVEMIFQNSTTTIVLYLDDNLTNDFVILPGFLTNAAILSSTSSNVPDGIYDAQLSYQDAVQNPIAFVDATNVLVDTTTQPPLLLAPTNNAVVNSSGLHFSYVLPEAPISGSVTITFQNSTNNIVLHLNDNLTNDFTVPSAFLMNAAAVTSVSSSTLPDGTYAVQLSYQDALANPAASAVATNILVDTVTQPPLLLSPADNVAVSLSGLHISYQLPEMPASGSVTITFQNSTTNIVLHLNDNQTNDFSVSPTSLTSAAAITSASGSVLPDGTYSVQLAYQDALFNPAASTGATNVLVDTVTQPPVLISPADNAVVNSTGLHINYQLPEAPASGSVRITLHNSATSIILNLNDARTNDFVVSPLSLLSAAAITSATSSMLPDGRYTVFLSYRDALLNPLVSIQSTNVLTVLETVQFFPTFISYSNGFFELRFTHDLPNDRGFNYDMMMSTNLNVPLNDWSDLGPVTELSPGYFQFRQLRTNNPAEFYILHVY